MRPDVVLVYVRELLNSLTGSRPEPDGDGDLPVRIDGAQFFVRVVGTSEPWVQVFSVAVTDLEPSPELFTELNEINRQLRFARAFHVGTQVLIESEIWADDVNPVNFTHACRYVASATDFFGPTLLTTFGGRPMFEESKTEEYPKSTAPIGFAAGPYL